MASNPLVLAARNLKPIRQGDYDNLCGLYAILNAIRIVLWPTTKLSVTDCKRLVNKGLDILEREEKLRYVHRWGMPEALFAALCRELLDEVDWLIGVTLARMSILGGVDATDIAGAIAAIDRHTQQGSPVLLVLYGRYDHYSVVIGTTKSRLLLFDSVGYRWISIDACDLHHRKVSKPHQIGRKCAAIIRRCD